MSWETVTICLFTTRLTVISVTCIVSAVVIARPVIVSQVITGVVNQVDLDVLHELAWSDTPADFPLLACCCCC